MYNECNTYDSFKNIINNLKNIKIKLLRQGILFNQESINELNNCFPQDKYKCVNMNINNDIIINIKPLESYQFKDIVSEINNIFLQYIISKLNNIKKFITPTEMQYLNNINNIKMLYSIEIFPNSFIIRI